MPRRAVTAASDHLAKADGTLRRSVADHRRPRRSLQQSAALEVRGTAGALDPAASEFCDQDGSYRVNGQLLASGDMIQRCHDATDNVIHVSEVAPMFPVVEDVDGLSGQDRLREQEQGHVRPTPGPVYGEEPETSHRQPRRGLHRCEP